MAQWKNDEEMFALMKEKLYTPVVGDILDQIAIFPKLVLTNRKIRQERKQCQYSKQLSPHNVSLFSKLQF